MSEDFETLTCRHCGYEVETDEAVDVETPFGPLSVCTRCDTDVGLVPLETTEGDHD